MYMNALSRSLTPLPLMAAKLAVSRGSVSRAIREPNTTYIIAEETWKIEPERTFPCALLEAYSDILFYGRLAAARCAFLVLPTSSIRDHRRRR